MLNKRLRISHHPSKPLIWWYKNRDLIDMNPSYQRKGRLWSPSDKAYLIDSIINGYDIPKLYIADFQMGESDLNQKRLPYAIIDGKQRLEAIFDFFDGNLVLNHDFIWRSDLNLRMGGLGLRDLKLNYIHAAEAFETESLDFVSVFTRDEDEINELFVRLNRSKPLTGAEIRNAIVGLVSDATRIVTKHSFFVDCIKFNTGRAADSNAAAKLLLFEYTENISNTKKRDLDSFAENKNIKEDSIDLATRRVISNLDTMAEIFLPKDELLSTSGIVPVFYWFIRNLGNSDLRYVREFLYDFERTRKEVIALGTSNSSNLLNAHSIDVNQLVRFSNLNRSTNDSGSHMGRYSILKREFKPWVRNRII